MKVFVNIFLGSYSNKLYDTVIFSEQCIKEASKK